MKKILSFLMIFILVFSSFPMQFAGAEELPCDEESICYEELLNEDGTVKGYSVIFYGGSNPYVVIPETFKGLPVLEIGHSAFKQANLYSVVMPDTVTVIRENAFYNTMLEKIVFPKNLIEIENGAFNFNYRLQEINLPDSVEKIGQYAFASNDLQTLRLPKNLKELKQGAFEGNDLTSLTFGGNQLTSTVFPFERNNIKYIKFEEEFPNFSARFLDKIWNVNHDSNFLYIDNELKIPYTGDATGLEYLYVKSTERKYFVLYDENGATEGAAPIQKDLAAGSSKVTVLDGDTLKKDNKRFIGWNTKADGSGDFYAAGSQITIPFYFLKLYAQYSDEQSIVKTYANGIVKTYITSYGDTLKLDAPEVPEHYSFNGWYTNDSYTEKYNETLPIYEDMNLYAKIQPVNYQVSFETNGAAQVAPVVVQGNTELYIGDIRPYKTEHYFDGWYYDKDLTSFTNYYVFGDSDKTLYAKWKPYTYYSINFETNGGSEMPSEKRMQYDTYYLTTEIPVKEDYNFVGWYYDELLTQPVEEYSYYMTQDLTFYAKWKKITMHTISYETNGGSNVSSEQVAEGTSYYFDFPTTKKSNYRFEGWFMDAEFQEPAVHYGIELYNDLTFYAKWTPLEVSRIVFETNGGSQIDSVKLMGDDLLNLADKVPTKEGFKFKGWYLDKELTKKATDQFKSEKNVTLYAKWEQVYFKAYINGFLDGTFQPNEAVKREQMAVMIANIMTNGQVPKSNGTLFTDIENSYAKDAIAYISKLGLMNGKTSITFDPKGDMTRAEIASVINRYINSQCEKGAQTDCKGNKTVPNFKDLKSTHWAAASINFVVSLGYMGGYPDVTFQPNKAITRAETVVVLNNVFKRPALPNNVTPRQFKDVTTHWAKVSIEIGATEFTIEN